MTLHKYPHLPGVVLKNGSNLSINSKFLAVSGRYALSSSCKFPTIWSISLGDKEPPSVFMSHVNCWGYDKLLDLNYNIITTN